MEIKITEDGNRGFIVEYTNDDPTTTNSLANAKNHKELVYEVNRILFDYLKLPIIKREGNEYNEKR